METMTVRQNWSDDRIDGLELKVDEGFRHVDGRFEQVDKRFEQVDQRLGRVENEISLLRQEVNQGFKSIEAGMRGHYRTMLTFCVGILAIFGTLLGALLTATLT
jgi:hypothetical protein